MEDEENPNIEGEEKPDMEDTTLIQKLLVFAIEHSGRIKIYASGLLLIVFVATAIFALSKQKPLLAVYLVVFGLAGVCLVFIVSEIIRRAKIKSVLNIKPQAQVFLWAVLIAFVLLLFAPIAFGISLAIYCEPKPLRIMLDIKCDESPTPTPTPTPTQTATPTPSIKITFPLKGKVAAHKGDMNGDLLDAVGTVENIDFDRKWRVCILDQSSSNQEIGKGFLQGECLSIKNKDWKITMSLGHKRALLPRNNGEGDTKSYNIMAILLDENGFNTFSSRCPSKDKEQNCDWEKPKEAIATDEVNIAAYVPK